MQILEQVEIKLDWKDLNNLHEHKYPTYTRSKGLHVTDILRKIALKTGQLKQSELDDEFAPLRVFLGMAWEQMCVRLYPETRWQPGELKWDGISGSPDGYCLNTAENTIEEFKFTAKSSRQPGQSSDTIRDVTKDWLWRNQILCYMALFQRCFEESCDLVRWHICYARGNYDYGVGMPPVERYIRYLCRAEPREIEGAYRMLVKNKFIV